jgi:hypothetical protein
LISNFIVSTSSSSWRGRAFTYAGVRESEDITPSFRSGNRASDRFDFKRFPD